MKSAVIGMRSDLGDGMRNQEPKIQTSNGIRSPRQRRRSVSEILRDSYKRFAGDKEARVAVNAILK